MLLLFVIATNFVPSALEATDCQVREPASVRSSHVSPEFIEVKMRLPSTVATNFVPSALEATALQFLTPALARSSHVSPEFTEVKTAPVP